MRALAQGQSGARDLKQQRTRAAIVRNTTTRKGTERRDRMERRWGQQELPLLRCVPPIAGSAAKRSEARDLEQQGKQELGSCATPGARLGIERSSRMERCCG